MTTTSTSGRLLYSRDEAAALLGISLHTLVRLVKQKNSGRVTLATPRDSQSQNSGSLEEYKSAHDNQIHRAASDSDYRG